MPSYKEIISHYDLDQLKNFRDVILDAIHKKESEDKKIVWRVLNRSMCYGNFRQEEYIKAIDFLANLAREVDSDPDSNINDRRIEINRELVPLSEYESYFTDK